LQVGAQFGPKLFEIDEKLDAHKGRFTNKQAGSLRTAPIVFDLDIYSRVFGAT